MNKNNLKEYILQSVSSWMTYAMLFAINIIIWTVIGFGN